MPRPTAPPKMNAIAKLSPTRRLALVLALSLLLSGCSTLSAPLFPETPKRDATASLIRHPQFRAVALAGPEWVNEALETITRYEAELAVRK